MFLEWRKSYSSWIEKKKFLCTRGHAFSPLLLPKPLFILSYHNTVQPSAQCNDHCEKNLLWNCRLCRISCIFTAQISGQTWVPSSDDQNLHKPRVDIFYADITTFLFQVPSAMSLPPKLPTSIFLQSPKSPWNYPKTKTPWIALAKIRDCGLCQPVL